MAEKTSVAFYPWVPHTFQMTACQGFGDSASRSSEGFPNIIPLRDHKFIKKVLTNEKGTL
jgi:hypothetical protein